MIDSESPRSRTSRRTPGTTSRAAGGRRAQDVARPLLGSGNGWAFLYANALVNAFTASIKEFPNIPTLPTTASIGSDVPKFVAANLVAPRPATGARRRHAKPR